MEENLLFLEEMERYYSNFNPNFMEGFIAIVNAFYDDLCNEGVISSSNDIFDIFKEFDQIIFHNDGVDLNESIENSIDFFEALNPRYKSMAINILSQSKISLGESQDSMAYDINLSGNAMDASLITHEVFHSFVVSKDQALNTDDENVYFNPLSIILSEINSYVSEFLYYDYMSEKKGVDIVPFDVLLSILVLGDLKRKEKYLKHDDEMFKVLCNGDALNNSESVFNYFHIDPSLTNKNSAVSFEQKMLTFSHPFGAMVACYIYQKILEDPSNVKMLIGLEKAQTMVGSDECVCRSLEKLGLPCFKDGKISLDEDAVSILTDATIKTFGMGRGKTEKQKTNLFGDGSLIKDQYIEEVNSVFSETEQELNKPKKAK